MLVKRWMSKNVITIDRNALMPEAIELMRRSRVPLLPVMRNQDLVGVVTDSDIKKASASEATSLEIHELLYLINRIKIKEIMTRPPITVQWNHTVDEAADIMRQKRISGAPVVDNQFRVVGVITQMDILKVLISLTAHQKKGIQVGLQVPDRKGVFKKIADIVRRYNGRILNFLTSRESAPEGYRELYIRFHEMDRKKLSSLLESLKTEAKLLFWIDHREGQRTILD
jgi:acetoin utilization protein AcuB